MSALREEIEASENRIAPRQRVMLAGRLSFNRGAFTIACNVMQLSATGARISVDGDLPVAQSLEISIPQRNIVRPARLIWRRGAQIGVAFEDVEAASAPPSTPVGKKGDLEAENQRLKALVVQLEARLKEMQEGY